MAKQLQKFCNFIPKLAQILKHLPMKHIVTLLVIALGMTGLAQTKNFIDQPYLETTARVDTLVAPDQIYLSIFISEKEDKNKISLETKERKMAQVLERLGINTEKQLKLNYLNSYNKNYFLRGKNILKTKTYTLEVYDALTAGKVLIGLEKEEISNVSLLKKTYSKLDALKISLKSKAILKARQQALALTKPLGQKLGKAIYINDGFFQDDTFYVSNRNLAYSPAVEMMDAEEPIDIEFSKIKVESEVSVRFAID